MGGVMKSQWHPLMEIDDEDEIDDVLLDVDVRTVYGDMPPRTELNLYGRGVMLTTEDDADELHIERGEFDHMRPGAVPGQDHLAAVNSQFAGAIKRDATNLKTLSLAGTAGATDILSFSVRLADAKAVLVKCAAVPGIAAYAQEQIADPALDVAASFAAMRNGIDACTAWIVANFPKDTSNWLQAQTIAADGRPADRVFSAAATASGPNS
jgi:hypothetical protein